MIYFIYDSSNNAVKIGVTKNLKVRLSMLQTGNPTKLEVVHVLENGSFEEEAILQSHYKQYNILNEWFRYVDEIKNDIADSNLEYIISCYEATPVQSTDVKTAKSDVPKLDNNKPEREEFFERKRRNKTKCLEQDEVNDNVFFVKPVRKLRKYATEEERRNAMREYRRSYEKQKRDAEAKRRVEFASDMLEKLLVKKKGSFISSRDLGEFLNRHNVKSKYGELNIPVQKVARHFDVPIKRLTINNLRTLYVVGLAFKEELNEGVINGNQN